MKGSAIPAEKVVDPQSIHHTETVYFLQLLLQGVPKTVENRGENCQKYAVSNFSLRAATDRALW